MSNLSEKIWIAEKYHKMPSKANPSNIFKKIFDL